MDKIRSAIAQIKVGASRGTGFLVSANGLLLTALHVVASLKENRDNQGGLKTYGSKISVRFGDPRQLAAGETLFTAEAVPEPGCHNVEEDWILLRVHPAPTIEPLPLVDLPDGANEVVWDSWGFSDADPEQGTWYRGILIPRPSTPKLELYSDQAAAGGEIPGLSGAPLLVANEVVGLVQSALLKEDQQGQKVSLEGKLFGRRLRSLMAPCKLAFANDGEPIPFVDDFLSLLDRLSPHQKQMIAQSLGIDTALVPDEALPRRIMRRLASVPFTQANTALARTKNVSPHESFELLRLAALSSLHPTAVETVRMGGARFERSLGAWLFCQWDGTAELFTRRAHAADWPQAWEKLTVDVPLSGTEPTAETVIENVRLTLGERFPSWKARKDFPAMLRSKEFCLILRTVLAPEYLRTVCGEFTRARVLIATPRAVETTLSDWLLVRPELNADFEYLVGDAFDSFRS